MNRKHLPLLLFFLICAISASSQDVWDLRKCFEYAKETNLTLQQSRLDQVTSGINLKEAQASRHPSLRLNSGTSWNYGRAFDPFTNDRVDVNTNGFNAGANLSLPLFNGFNIINSIERARINQQIASLNLSNAENVLGLNVATSYLNVLLNLEILEQRETQVAATKEQRDRMKKLVDAGTRALTDYLELDAQMSIEETNVVNAQNQLQNAYLELQQLMNLSPSSNFRIEKPDLPDVGSALNLESASSIYEYAEQTQPDVQSADLGIQSAQKSIAISRSFGFPSLSFGSSANTGYSKRIGDEIDEFQNLEDNLNYSLSLGLNIPIYSQRQIRSGVERAEVNLQQAEILADQTRLTLRQTIERSYLDVTNTFNQYQLVERQIRSQQLAFDNAQKQLDLGVINSVDYLLAQNRLQQSILSQIQLKYQYHFRSQILDFYKGESLDFD
ncbi:MAG: TolC family protein [Bacteroidota bacterium]